MTTPRKYVMDYTTLNPVYDFHLDVSQVENGLTVNIYYKGENHTWIAQDMDQAKGQVCGIMDMWEAIIAGYKHEREQKQKR